MGKNLWSAEELEILVKHYKQIPKEDILKLLPNRNWQSLKMKASKLKLGIQRIPWTDKENEILTKMWTDCEAQEIGDKLGRTRSAVYEQSKVLNLGKKISYSYWTDEEIKNLKELYPIETKENLIRFFNRPYSSIEHKALRLGLKKV